MLCEGVSPKAKVRNSGRMVLVDVFKLLQIGKLRKLGPLNAGEKFINNKKKKKKNVMIIVKTANCYVLYNHIAP